ncbi:hypothetical protein ACQFX9_27840 [Aliinostoc sp. HNIBRCY26]|uniref:hypothetical protein n=1 Tax=Aliinostoc sp. HNIBRCY26 TaxID=3418997 RepID=UPI003D020DD2
MIEVFLPLLSQFPILRQAQYKSPVPSPQSPFPSPQSPFPSPQSPIPNPQSPLTLNSTEPTVSFFQVEFCLNIAIFTDAFPI